MLLNHKRQNQSSTGSCDFKSETFLLKLFQILKNNKYTNCIQWSDDGKSIVISNITQLTKKILPKFFKHNNYASFVRQLNMYNFHKVRNNNQKQKENEQIFQHEKFRRDQNWEGILNIKRKIKYDINLDKKPLVPKDDLTKIQSYIDALKNKSVSKSTMEHMIVFLLDKTKESLESQKKLKKEVEELTKKNNFLLTQVSSPFNFKKLSDGVNLLGQALAKASTKDPNVFQHLMYNAFFKSSALTQENNTRTVSPTVSDNKVQKNESFVIQSDPKFDLLNCNMNRNNFGCCDYCPFQNNSFIECDISKCDLSKMIMCDFDCNCEPPMNSAPQKDTCSCDLFKN